MDLTFYVPCLNESKNIGSTIDTIAEAMSPFDLQYEILVFDDGSHDGTGNVVRRIAQAHSELKLKLIQNKSSLGLGYNYFAGAKIACGKYYTLVNGDNDGTPEMIQQLIQHLGEADVLIPYLEKDHRNLTRRTLSWTFTRLVQILSGTRLKYYNCAVVHLTANVRKWGGATSGYGYQAELLCDLVRSGKSYIEFPIVVRLRGSGTSKAFNIRNFSSVGASLCRILNRNIHRTFNTTSS